MQLLSPDCADGVRGPPKAGVFLDVGDGRRGGKTEQNLIFAQDVADLFEKVGRPAVVESQVSCYSGGKKRAGR